ncbi:MAG: murein biosynthesis integral membrane protein MurJ [Candidatus Mcinerneyibacterium aminivorans]|uniref:Probable lipid II flippase MurJ n=1 Tax=Candidatus Mcinerneyibacterium aminivorans TaxID=2703815 RepID=A0A5D0MHL3_9BACT|nr:MAG: murein biosynthesis integral membrane protein MurJ [Candidatus Mcinerneyibacterium aminivorans]
MKKKINIFRSAFFQSAIIFSSKLLGLLRNILIASYFGVSPLASAFTLALMIPYKLRRILGESALDAFFVPVYTAMDKKYELKRVNFFISNLISSISVLVIIIIIFAQIFMGDILSVITHGLAVSSPEAFLFGVSLSKITILFLFSMPIIAIFMGLFHANGSFLLPATNSIILNIFVIFSLVYFSRMGDSLKDVGFKVGYAYIIAGIVIILYQYFLIRKRYNFKFSFNINLKTEGIKRIFKMMLPATLSMAVFNINFLIDTFLASFIRGGAAISVFRYSEIIVQFPIGVIGVAIFNTSLPSLSRHVKDGNIKKSKNIFERLLRFLIYLSLPISFGIFAIKHNFISLIYQYKNFNVSDVGLVTNVLQYFLIGLIGFLGVRIAASLFYAKEEVQIPLKVSVVAVLVNIVLNFILVVHMETAGLALASSIAGIVNIVLLILIANRKYFKINFKEIGVTFIKAFVASFVMYLIVSHISGLFEIENIGDRIVSVLVPVIAGIISYIFLSLVLKIQEFSDIFKNLVLNKK